MLRCRDEGLTRLPVSWFKKATANNLIKLKQTDNLKLNGGRLTINKVQFSDDGIYLCKTNLDSITSILSVEQGKEKKQILLIFFFFFKK